MPTGTPPAYIPTPERLASIAAIGIKPPSGYSLAVFNAPISRWADSAVLPAHAHRAAANEPQPLLPVPPDATTAITSDMEWTFPAPGASVTLEHFIYGTTSTPPDLFQKVSANPFAWTIGWKHGLDGIEDIDTARPPRSRLATCSSMRIYDRSGSASANEPGYGTRSEIRSRAVGAI